MKFVWYGLFVLVVLSPLAAVSEVPTVESKTSEQVSLTPDESLLLTLINSEREERRLPALSLDPILTEVARRHSSDMAKRDYFSHIDPQPNPLTPLDRYAKALGKQSDLVVGENLGRAEQPLMGMLHECMMKSPEHKANILDKDYTQIGVGIYMLPDGKVWITQMYAGKPQITR